MGLKNSGVETVAVVDVGDGRVAGGDCSAAPVTSPLIHRLVLKCRGLMVYQAMLNYKNILAG